MELQIDMSQSLTVPLMARDKFAELIGVEIGVVNAWIARGYLPVFEVGRYRLVNLALLTKMALEKEFSL